MEDTSHVCPSKNVYINSSSFPIPRCSASGLFIEKKFARGILRTMLVDGKAVAENVTRSLRERVTVRAKPLVLTIISIAPNFATEKYLGIKRRVAESIGVALSEVQLSEETTTDELVEVVATHVATSAGIVLQLPYPEHIVIEKVLALLPRRLDVDCIGKEAVDAYVRGDWQLLPPVVAAIAHLVREHGIMLRGKRVAVVGQGRLVGKPAALWAAHEGADVVTLTKESLDRQNEIARADILILGAGVPGLVVPDMVKDGVVIFDAGASEEAGRLVGDADSACSEKAALFTPVPGGIGPIAVAKLFENLIFLWSHD